jgi:putative lipoic acid-binding regulatory protein
MPDQDTATLLAFPCDFPIKVMGKRQAAFAQTMVDIVQRHAPDFDPASLEMRASREATYLSLTLTIRATSREQLDELYRELCDHPMVTMVL